jgi:hypothetical protein
MRPETRPAKVRVSIRSGAENLRPGDTIEGKRAGDAVQCLAG